MSCLFIFSILLKRNLFRLKIEVYENIHLKAKTNFLFTNLDWPFHFGFLPPEVKQSGYGDEYEHALNEGGVFDQAVDVTNAKVEQRQSTLDKENLYMYSTGCIESKLQGSNCLFLKSGSK